MQENLNKFIIEMSSLINSHLKNPKINLKKNNFEGDLYVKLNNLQKKGICTFTINQKLIDELNTNLTNKFDQIEKTLLKKKKDKVFKIKFNDFNKVIDQNENNKVYQVINDFLIQSKAYDIVEQFLNCNVKIKAIAAQFNNNVISNYFYGELDNEFLPKNNKFDYMHLDSKILPRLKILIYLNKVTEENGPFRYSTETSQIMPIAEKIIRKTNDRIKLNDEGYNSLPKEFRKHAFLARHEEDKKQNKELLDLGLKKEIKLLSENGENNVILFDVDGIHRGGFVSKKSRRILQVLFEKK